MPPQPLCEIALLPYKLVLNEMVLVLNEMVLVLVFETVQERATALQRRFFHKKRPKLTLRA